MNTVRAARALRSLASLGACIALAALAGCGDSTKARATGKVTYKGAAVTGGTLTLSPASGTAYPIPIKPDGTFDVSDVPLGVMGVAIETDSVGSGGLPNMPPGMTPPKDAVMPQNQKDYDMSKMGTKVAIPPKYKDAKSSGLTWEIKAGKNDKNFELTD